MQAKLRGVPTITEQARRAQIVSAAIETIAELDYATASFSRIAIRAGLSSTGLISYHFSGKQDLMDEVMRTITAEFTAYVLAKPDDGTATGVLRTFLESNLDFIRDHRAHVVTMLRIQHSSTSTEKASARDAADRAALAEVLAAGQTTGEFGAFDPDLMAGFILSLRNGVIVRVGSEPDFDLDHCGAELLAVVERATGKEKR